MGDQSDHYWPDMASGEFYHFSACVSPEALHSQAEADAIMARVNDSMAAVQQAPEVPVVRSAQSSRWPLLDEDARQTWENCFGEQSQAFHELPPEWREVWSHRASQVERAPFAQFIDPAPAAPAVPLPTKSTPFPARALRYTAQAAGIRLPGEQ